MIVIDYRKAIREGEMVLLAREREQSLAFIRDRIRFLRLLKSGQCSSLKQAGQFINLSLRSSQRLWKLYQGGGLQTLLSYPYQGKPCRLSEEQMGQLKDYLSHDGVQFLHEVKAYIEQHFGFCYSISGLHRLFKRMKVKKKTGRPSNYRKDEKGAKAFKKTLAPW